MISIWCVWWLVINFIFRHLIIYGHVDIAKLLLNRKKFHWWLTGGASRRLWCSLAYTAMFPIPYGIGVFARGRLSFPEVNARVCVHSQRKALPKKEMNGRSCTARWPWVVASDWVKISNSHIHSFASHSQLSVVNEINIGEIATHEYRIAHHMRVNSTHLHKRKCIDERKEALLPAPAKLTAVRIFLAQGEIRECDAHAYTTAAQFQPMRLVL